MRYSINQFLAFGDFRWKTDWYMFVNKCIDTYKYLKYNIEWLILIYIWKPLTVAWSVYILSSSICMIVDLNSFTNGQAFVGSSTTDLSRRCICTP
jgi:hypothetical protein